MKLRHCVKILCGVVLTMSNLFVLSARENELRVAVDQEIDKVVSELDISAYSTVVYRQSDQPYLRIKGSEEALKRVHHKIEGGKLRIWSEKVNNEEGLNIQNSNNRTYITINGVKYEYGLQIEVSTPTLTSVDLSSCVKMEVEGEIDSNELDIDLSGCSFLTFSGNVKDCKFNVSGCSFLTIDNRGKNRMLKGDVSGCSHCTFKNLDTDKVKLDVSGCSFATIDGKAANADVSASGLSNVNIRELKSDNLDTDVSGMSSLRK